MNEIRSSGFGNLTPVVKNLLIINAIVFVALMNPMLSKYIITYGASYYFDSPNAHVWQLITYAFIHSPSNISHIFFNMFALYMFGSTLETILGTKRFITFYVITAVGAIILQQLINAYQVYELAGTAMPYSEHTNILSPEAMQTLQSIYFTPTLGASGAIFGLLLAYGYLFPNAMLYVYFFFPIKAKYFVVIYALIELYLGVNNSHDDNIAHYAHLGGMLFGFAMLKYWDIRRPNIY